MKLRNLSKRTKSGYTTFGAMWKMGECSDDSLYMLKSDDNRVPMESKVTAYWHDGSVKWTSHTANACLLNDEIEVLKTDEAYNYAKKVDITETENSISLKTDFLEINITKNSKNLVDTLYYKNDLKCKDIHSVLILEEPTEINGNRAKFDKDYTSIIEKVSIENEGPLKVCVKYEGTHISKTDDKKIQFIIRMKVFVDTSKIDFMYTFIYDGDEEKDYLKGLGLRFTKPMHGYMYNRHVKMEIDNGYFIEPVAHLSSWRPRFIPELLEKQANGLLLDLDGEPLSLATTILKDTPYWSEYDICQNSSSNFLIKKKTIDDNCCYIDSLSGYRTHGTVSFGDEKGSIIIAQRDFFEKYPSGYTFKNLDTNDAEATVWLWSPSTTPMDFRHYANRGYNSVCYEGYDFKGASPYGIAVTSEFSIDFDENVTPSDETFLSFKDSVNNPPMYVASPEYYHELNAFGRWSLPSYTTEMEKWIEKQLDLAVDFYINEVSNRDWYGMFNYGDFMHTYDEHRHQWKYDVGGYAWDNTELVPTLWLWLMFMRTGREDVFTLAEKLTRHTSEVDVYHIGDLKGLGSRHNVRHWGCPCKEARIAMAGHHRYYYYMTGDERLTDIFDELKDNENTFLVKDPLETFYDKSEMKYPSHARTGPDWSSLVANWFTRWERFNDTAYKDKINIGIEDIKNAPLQLVSGPDFEFDPVSLHLGYIGERTSGGTHLQICMGSPQVWIELSDLLEDDVFTKMLADYGRFYFLDDEERIKESNGLIGDREFSLPFMATAMGAFGANYFNDKSLSDKTWATLLDTLIQDDNFDGLKSSIVKNKGNKKDLVEISFVTTNFVAQWCLNAIMCLEFIREGLPKSYQETTKLINTLSKSGFRKA